MALWGKSLVETGPWWLGLGHGGGTGVRREDQSARECGGGCARHVSSVCDLL